MAGCKYRGRDYINGGACSQHPRIEDSMLRSPLQSNAAAVLVELSAGQHRQCDGHRLLSLEFCHCLPAAKLGAGLYQRGWSPGAAPDHQVLGLA
jgi:hypothetical protein